MKYIAMDFEAGNRLCISACSIGLALYEDDRLIGRESYLIHPPTAAGRFDRCAVKIHGIKRAQLVDSPDFAGVWQQIAHHFAPDANGQPPMIICHNAAFDTRVLVECLTYYKLPLPDCPYLCTVVLSRKLWPERKRYRLNLMAEMLDLELNHHEAGSDAYACGEILQYALRQTHCADALALLAHAQLPLLHLKDISLVPKEKPKRRRKRTTVTPTKVSKPEGKAKPEGRAKPEGAKVAKVVRAKAATSPSIPPKPTRPTKSSSE